MYSFAGESCLRADDEESAGVRLRGVTNENLFKLLNLLFLNALKL